MKSKISIVSLFVCIFVSSSSFAQYKYDIGLRMSSYDMERFQLDARFHLDSPYSLLFSVVNGSSYSGNYSQTPVFNDSLIQIQNSSYNTTNNLFKFGVQRKLGFLATDVFYAGATVGFGFDRQNSLLSNATYSVETDSLGNLQDPYLSAWEYQNSDFTESTNRAVSAQLSLSFGMDVPISKRFSINAEIGLTAGYRHSLSYSINYIDLIGSVSGGLRYSFGKRS
ncbi:MAG: hypothetical protein AB8B56_20555 [Crocinitomicaceae bacterium]